MNRRAYRSRQSWCCLIGDAVACTSISIDTRLLHSHSLGAMELSRRAVNETKRGFSPTHTCPLVLSSASNEKYYYIDIISSIFKLFGFITFSLFSSVHCIISRALGKRRWSFNRDSNLMVGRLRRSCSMVFISFVLLFYEFHRHIMIMIVAAKPIVWHWLACTHTHTYHASKCRLPNYSNGNR